MKYYYLGTAVILIAFGFYIKSQAIRKKDEKKVQSNVEVSTMQPMAKEAVTAPSKANEVVAEREAEPEEAESLADLLHADKPPAHEMNPDRAERTRQLSEDILNDEEFSKAAAFIRATCDATSCIITVEAKVDEPDFILAAVKYLGNNRAVGERLTVTTDSFAPRAVNVSTTTTLDKNRQ